MRKKSRSRRKWRKEREEKIDGVGRTKTWIKQDYCIT
jgi:hypothetical protein